MLLDEVDLVLHPLKSEVRQRLVTLLAEAHGGGHC